MHSSNLKTIVIGLTVLYLIFPTTNAEAQKKEYFKFELSYPLAGTPRLIKKTFIDEHYSDPTTIGFQEEYPNSRHYPSFALEYGWFIKAKTSVSIFAGLEEAGRARGYSSKKRGITYNFTNWIVRPKINFHGKGVVFGLGPSGLLVNLKTPESHPVKSSQSKFLPGLGLKIGSDPKKTKGFRMSVFAAVNLYPTFETDILTYTVTPTGLPSFPQTYTFKTDVNPTNMQMGLGFQF